jgi:hypothetical protein
MFGRHDQPAKSQTESAEDRPAVAAKPAEGSNPLWQSLSMKPVAERDSSTHESSEAHGEVTPLDPEVRPSLEQFFHRPLDHVRVHRGAASREATNSLGALAMTVGQDIHLGAQAETLSDTGRDALLAHETVHTMQQGEVASAPLLSSLAADAEGSPHEREADALSTAFMSHRAGHSAALAIRDSIGLRQMTAGRAQLSRISTHYGDFEDHKFNDLVIPTGDKVGVQMYLKFHPGTNVDAKKIGLTQTAEGKQGGVQDTAEIRGRRQATSGAGVGYFIDRVAGRPSPLYGTTGTATAGADATKFEGYAAPGIVPLTPAQKSKLPFTGIDYGGGSIFGFRYMDGTTLKEQPAEMHDAAALPVSNSSEQIFETTALAFEGAMAGTYFGSVEWGWRRDASGTFTSVPISRKSMGMPSVNFLTAANIWNTSKENYTLLANANPTSIVKADGTTITVPQGTPLREISRSTTGGVTSILVAVVDGSGNAGVVNAADTTIGDLGRETVDLPVPQIHTVNVVGGTVLDGETRCSASDPMLPQGTRVRILGPFSPNVPGYVRVEVVDGPLIGRRGVLAQSKLTREALGTR